MTRQAERTTKHGRWKYHPFAGKVLYKPHKYSKAAIKKHPELEERAQMIDIQQALNMVLEGASIDGVVASLVERDYWHKPTVAKIKGAKDYCNKQAVAKIKSATKLASGPNARTGTKSLTTALQRAAHSKTAKAVPKASGITRSFYKASSRGATKKLAKVAKTTGAAALGNWWSK